MAISNKADFEDVYQWGQYQQLPILQWTCGYCNERVASRDGYPAGPVGKPGPSAYIRICPNCFGPTFFSPKGHLHPRSSTGKDVLTLPPDLHALYGEARRSAAANAPTASVLVCRKILMHIGVQEKAEENTSFMYYVEYLSEKGFVPPNGKSWVDYIRKRGNEANHDIVIMSDADADALISFVEMLLRFIYDFPNLVPPDRTSANA
jgi:hypothetical protein